MGFHYTKDHPCPGTREENQHCQVSYLSISLVQGKEKEKYTLKEYLTFSIVIESGGFHIIAQIH